MLSIFALRAFFWKHERVLNMLFNIGQLHHELLFFLFFVATAVVQLRTSSFVVSFSTGTHFWKEGLY